MARGVENTQQMIVRWRDGQTDARDRLIDHLLPELAKVAGAQLRREANSSLSTGDLINQVVIGLIRAERLEVNDRAHFIALSSRLMRNILIDHSRAKSAGKRAHHRIELHTRVEGEVRIDLVELDSALKRLGAIDPALMEIVEMRYFGGMTTADIAEVSGLSEPTVKRRWQAARAWLADALTNPIDNA